MSQTKADKIEAKLVSLRNTLREQVAQLEVEEEVESFLFDSGTMETGITVEEPKTGKTHDFYVFEEDFLGPDITEGLTEEELMNLSEYLMGFILHLDDIRIYSARLVALEDIASNGFPEDEGDEEEGD